MSGPRPADGSARPDRPAPAGRPPSSAFRLVSVFVSGFATDRSHGWGVPSETASGPAPDGRGREATGPRAVEDVVAG